MPPMQSMNSWDVLGIYPESTTAEGTYRDDEILSKVQQHNSAIRGRAKGGAVAQL